MAMTGINHVAVIFLGAVLVTSLCLGAAQTTVHVVGDSLGWTIPQGGANVYVNWTASKTFVVGDTLVFNFGTDRHDVLQVPKASYDSCSSGNAIGSVITTGPANITLTSAGEKYYICTFSQHCSLGQKLSITVSTPGAAPSPRAASAPVSPPTNTTDPAACPPDAAAPSPGTTRTTTTTTTTTPPGSSSHVITAGLLFPIISICISWLI